MMQRVFTVACQHCHHGGLGRFGVDAPGGKERLVLWYSATEGSKREREMWRRLLSPEKMKVPRCAVRA